MGEEKKDDVIAFDFDKVKKFFKKLTTPRTKSDENNKTDSNESGEAAIDMSAVVNVFKKYHIFLLVLIPLILSFTIRAIPAELPITDDWAQERVTSYFKGQIATSVQQQYPNLPAENQNALVNEQYAQYLAQNKDNIDAQVQQVSADFRARFQDDSGQTYLLAIDPWTYYRLVRNYIDHGHIGDKIVDGKSYDALTMAPIGQSIGHIGFHMKAEYYLYKIAKFFNEDVSLLTVVFFIPAIFATLAVIPAFFLGRRIGGNIGGLLTSILIAIHQSFLTRTSAGFADTDAYSVLFPLLIVWFFFEGYEAQTSKKRYIYMLLAGLMTGLFSRAWGGWSFIVDLILLSVVSVLAYLLIKRKYAKLKHMALNGVAYIASTAMFITIFEGFRSFLNIFGLAISFTEFKSVGLTKLWPQVYTTVAELNSADLHTVISNIGGTNLLFLSLVGIVLLLYRKVAKPDMLAVGLSAVWYFFLIRWHAKFSNLMLFLVMLAVPVAAIVAVNLYKKQRTLELKYTALFLAWIAAIMYGGSKGIRFIMLMIPPYALGIGALAGISIDKLSNYFAKEFNLKKWITVVLSVVIIAVMLINPIQGAINTANNEVPSMTDAWYETLTNIRDNSEEDATITSWWDFGHWFKAVGERPVTFDGASQNTPMAHWVGRMLLTSDEKEAVGILRMLDCGSYTGFDKLHEVIEDNKIYEDKVFPRTIDLLKEIILLDRKDAYNRLVAEGLPKSKVDDVLDLTHCEPPEGFVIASQDMIGKSGVWSHFGSWDFNRAYMYNKVITAKNEHEAIQFLSNEFNLSTSDAQKTYNEIQGVNQKDEADKWIAPWPSYVTGVNGCTKLSETQLTCFNGVPGANANVQIDVDMEADTAIMRVGSGTMIPTGLVYPKDDGSVVSVTYDNQTYPYSIIIVPDGNGNYGNIFAFPELADSMFTRMFFFRGHGLSHFEPFDYRKSVIGWDIYTYKVNWESGERTNVLAPAETEPDASEVEMSQPVETEMSIREDAPVDAPVEDEAGEKPSEENSDAADELEKTVEKNAVEETTGEGAQALGADVEGKVEETAE